MAGTERILVVNFELGLFFTILIVGAYLTFKSILHKASIYFSLIVNHA